ncbi:hypothetical protein SKAU_G00301930 [Synaphobranchus kaupii]|uniref:Uncharacterized protein n=1 Tax=Synaphobranchus kaupii TaxID=118154 RepID=A0A9Q1IL93_SYNKA|nr:hypothetical protein SKAU_G00301930 [Synaphobranchus kaupii]
MFDEGFACQPPSVTERSGTEDGGYRVSRLRVRSLPQRHHSAGQHKQARARGIPAKPASLPPLLALMAGAAAKPASGSVRFP